jgi:hypothetical protein
MYQPNNMIAHMSSQQQQVAAVCFSSQAHQQCLTQLEQPEKLYSQAS